MHDQARHIRSAFLASIDRRRRYTLIDVAIVVVFAVALGAACALGF